MHDEALKTLAARSLETADDPLRAAFLARARKAVTVLIGQLTERELGEATGASSDYDVLIRALEQPSVISVLRHDDPLVAARLRGLRARARLLEAEGGVLDGGAAAALLGVTRQAVDKRRRVRHLLAVRTGTRHYAYPAWQFGPHGVLSGLPEALSDLREHDPWMQMVFFLSESSYLDGARPLDALRRGDISAVRRAARNYGEQGAA